MANLSVEFSGLKLKNPLIAASAGTTKDALHCRQAQDAGFGAVILKSIQEESVNRYNPFPRMTVIRNGISGYHADTFMTYEQAFEGNLKEYCDEIKKAKEMLDIPVIASLNCAREETWAEYAVECEKAGADAIEVVPSCPVGAFVREGVEFYPIASKAVRDVREAVKIPAGLKMTQQMANPIVCAMDLEKDGADWLTMFNRSVGFEVDIETMEPIMHKGFCGHGGPWVIQSVMHWIAATRSHVKCPISATGGVTNYEDVIRYLLSGAANVKNVTDIIGVAAEKVLPLDKADRSRRYFAQVDYEKCVGCKKCFPVCIYGAISNDGKQPVIDSEKCDGCGLCSQICGRAITMKGKGDRDNG